MTFFEVVHRAIEAPPVLVRFAIGIGVIVIVPELSRRIRLPAAVGLLAKAAAINKPATNKLEFTAKTLFIPTFLP
jgi:hypothetical protein